MLLSVPLKKFEYLQDFGVETKYPFVFNAMLGDMVRGITLVSNSEAECRRMVFCLFLELPCSVFGLLDDCPGQSWEILVLRQKNATQRSISLPAINETRVSKHKMAGPTTENVECIFPFFS
jgi:hypothetical protein